MIVSDIGAAPETIVRAGPAGPNYTGWVVPCRDAASLAARIDEAMQLAPQERAALGARAKVHATGKFSLAEMQRSTLAVYDELLGIQLAREFDARG